MTDFQNDLTLALVRFVEDALAVRDQLLAGIVHRDIHSFVARLADMPSARTADAVALETAKRNSYLLRKRRAGAEIRRAGRPLTADALIDTGVAALLISGRQVQAATLAKELAGYLAGPPIPIWEYAIIDADLGLTGPIPVTDGWELVTPSSEELAGLMGVPLGAHHQSHPAFRLDLYGGLAMLRRADPEGRPHAGWILHFDFRPAHTLWQPLLALSLYQNAVVQLWAKYHVEPGRRVDVLFDHVYTEPWTPDGVTEIEVVRHGDYRVDDNQEKRFRHFLQKLDPLLAVALAQPEHPTRRTRERAARLRRVAEHFITAGEEAHGEGEVLSEFNADAVLHYVIALEAILTGSDSDKSELTRKVVQRAAIIAGTDDGDRLAVAETVHAAYAARSAYAHGSEPEAIDLPALRRVVRDCVLARLILGDPIGSGATWPSSRMPVSSITNDSQKMCVSPSTTSGLTLTLIDLLSNHVESTFASSRRRKRRLATAR